MSECKRCADHLAYASELEKLLDNRLFEIRELRREIEALKNDKVQGSK